MTLDEIKALATDWEDTVAEYELVSKVPADRFTAIINPDDQDITTCLTKGNVIRVIEDKLRTIRMELQECNVEVTLPWENE